MWDIRPNVNCQLVKRSENEANFIRDARGCVSGVIQRRIGTHVGGQMNTEAQVAMLKPSQKGSCGCIAGFDACILCYGCCGCL